MSQELTANLKKSLVWSVFFSYSIQQQTISQVDCDVWRKVDFIQLVMTSSVAGQRRSSKAFPKAKLGPKKGHGHCLVICCPLIHYSFLNPGKPLYLRSILSKLMRCTENCNSYSWHWSTGKTQFFSTAMPDHTSHNFGSWTNWAMKFCPICHIRLTSRQPTTTSSSISTSFCRGNTSTTSRREFVESWSTDFFFFFFPKHRFLCYRNKQTFLIGKNVLIVMVPILI